MIGDGATDFEVRRYIGYLVVILWNISFSITCFEN